MTKREEGSGFRIEWRDGRSDPVSRISGPIALEHLAKNTLHIEPSTYKHLGGTIFAGEKKTIIARTCLDSTLITRAKHISNVSLKQHKKVLRETRRVVGRKLRYLFITTYVADEDNIGIDYWFVPSIKVRRVLDKLSKEKKGKTKNAGSHDAEGKSADLIRLVINEEDGKDFLNGEIDIQKYKRTITLSQQQISEILEAKKFEEPSDTTEILFDKSSRMLIKHKGKTVWGPVKYTNYVIRNVDSIEEA